MVFEYFCYLKQLINDLFNFQGNSIGSNKWITYIRNFLHKNLIEKDLHILDMKCEICLVFVRLQSLIVDQLNVRFQINSFIILT